MVLTMLAVLGLAGPSGLARSEMTMIGLQLMFEGGVNTIHRIAPHNLRSDCWLQLWKPFTNYTSSITTCAR